MKFKSDIEVQAGLKDSSGANGTSGQVLSSNGSTVSWVNESLVASDVQNQVKAGVAINKGQAVYVTGADGTNIIVGLASNTSEATSSKTLGLLNATVAVNGFADVVQIGRLAGLDTSTAIAGDPVWLGTNGNLIYGLANKPYAPAHLVFIGVVTRVNANNGEIFIAVQNGFELNEIHDVDIKTDVPINGDVLGYNGTLWVNKTIAEWLGFTPVSGTGASSQVAFWNGTSSITGESNLFWDATNDRLGIGTAIPLSRLHVDSLNTATDTVGNVFISASDSLAANIGGQLTLGGLYNGSSKYAFGGIAARKENATSGNVAGYLALMSTTSAGALTERMRITSGGNVGIGTLSPSQKLHVEGLSYFGSDMFLAQNGGIFFDGNSSYGSGIFGRNFGEDLAMNAGGSERMRITSGGNVGIGNASPDYKLSVNGSSSFGASPINGNPTNDFSIFRGISISDGSAAYGSYGGFILSANTQWTGSAKRFLITNVLGANKFGIIRSVDAGTNPSIGVNGVVSSGTADFVINDTGNISIGTTTDAGYKLDVNGTGRFSGDLTIDNGQLNTPKKIKYICNRATAGSYGDIEWYNVQWDGLIKASIGAETSGALSNGALVFRTSGGGSNATERMRIAGNGDITATSTITATGFFNSSDNRLKDLIDYDYNVSDIKPITYLWKDLRDNKKHIGYSAQEVQKVMPDAVNEDADGMLSVNYIEVLVAKIAELENRIKQLEK